MNLYIYSYNNYYNRIVKKAGDNIEDYQDFLHYGPVQGVYGFTPGDGVNTIQLIGSAIQAYDGKGDYLIAHNPETNEIDSRWFIIDVDRARNGQWTLTLRRDLVVDYYDIIIDSPMFIEKATLNAEDSLVFNSENMTVNQIKTSETLLKDKSGCAWLVGYYAKNATISGTAQANEIGNLPYFSIDSTIEQWPFYQYTSENFYGPINSGNINICANIQGRYRAEYIVNLLDGSDVVGKFNTNSTQNQNRYIGLLASVNSTNLLKENAPRAMSTIRAFVYGSIPQINNLVEFENFYSFNNTLIKTSDNKYYEIKIKQVETNKQFKITPIGNLYTEIENLVTEECEFTRQSANALNYEVTVKSTGYKLTIEEREDLTPSYNITGNAERLVTTDAPWNIFAIPFGTIKCKYQSNTIRTSANIAINVVSAILTNSDAAVSDLQLLPYCPVQDLITDDGEITFENANQFSYITASVGSESYNVGVIINVPLSKFSANLFYSFENGQTSILKKLNNECDKWRLSSPNYSNYFDFSVEKNGGIQFFNIDCEYKPHTPYIHINPNFSNLYGYDDDSPRGLVLGGDFSISRVKDEWSAYLVQNKNFQNIFDRQIQNMEVQHKVGRIQDIAGGIAGIGSGVASGALTGSLIMPGIGTAVGAIAGGVMSAVGGAADYATNEKLRAEALDYTKDMFGYQLGNIQALPQTISKVSAFNNNNKLFPILEYYTCTDREKIAFLNKIAWNGMSVGAIGKISDYTGNEWTYTINDETIESKGYIKGQLIRLELPIDHEQSLHSENYHVINEISGELYKGVYIK